MGRWEYKLQHQEHQDYYEIMKEHLGIEPEFRDLISYRIIATSESEVKKCFEYYKEGWALLGKDTSNHSEVYNEFFNIEESGYVMSTEEILKANDNIIEHARDSNLVLDNRKQNSTHFDIDEEDAKPKTRRCIKCNKLFNTISNNTCNSCKREEDNFPFSFNGALYLGIACTVIYILYNNLSISYTGFLILGGLALFVFLYFQDNYKKK